MDLRYTEEQTLLRDSAERFVSSRYDATLRKRIAASPSRVSEPLWTEMAGLGWLGLALPEALGGLGAGAVDTGLLMAALGKGLVLEPVASVLLAGHLLASCADARQQDRWLRPLAEGRSRLVLAHAEPGLGLYDLPCTTRARRVDGGWRLDGLKSLVSDGPSADAFIVSAALVTDGETAIDANAPLGLFVIAASDCTRQDVDTLDGRRACSIRLQDHFVADAEHLAGTQAALFTRALDLAVTAACAEAVGVMQVLLDATVEYTRTRQQFGRPLASNQVLQHRMVNMAAMVEEARAIALRAALWCDRHDVDERERARAVSGAKLKVTEAARFVAESAVQLHGAMGVTDELDIGQYFKRLLVLELSLGTRAEHLARCIALRFPAKD